MILITTYIIKSNTIVKVADSDETMTTIIKIILGIMIMMTSTDYNGNYDKDNENIMITMTKM